MGNICDGNDLGLDDQHYDFVVFRQSIMGCFGLPPNLMASKSCGLNGLDYGHCRQVRLGVVESSCSASADFRDNPNKGGCDHGILPTYQCIMALIPLLDTEMEDGTAWFDLHRG